MTEKTKEIKARADRLVELTAQKERVQAEMEEIKAWFENLAVNDLKDTGASVWNPMSVSFAAMSLSSPVLTWTTYHSMAIPPSLPASFCSDRR